MKRIFLNENASSAAIWSARIALFALGFFTISVWIVRAQFIDFKTLFSTIAVLAGVCGLLVAASFILMVIAAYSIWQDGVRGTMHIAFAALICILLLAVPAFIGARLMLFPALADLSTDFDSPPVFVSSQKALVLREGFEAPALILDNRLIQKKAYPDIIPLFLDVPPDEAVEFVLSALQNRGLLFVETQVILPTSSLSALTNSPTQKGRGGRSAAPVQPADKTKDKLREVPTIPQMMPTEYRIQAIGRSFIIGLPMDIVIRLRPKGDGVRIDFRFVSRTEHHDLGEKAYLMRKLSDEIKFIATAQ